MKGKISEGQGDRSGIEDRERGNILMLYAELSFGR